MASSRSHSGTQAREYDYLFKLLIIGDSGSGSGKRALLSRLADDVVPTVGVDFLIKTINVNGERMKLQIWDTAGQERFHTITSSYYRGARGVIVIYNVTNVESFTSVKKWLQDIDANCGMASKVLVGNKDGDASSFELVLPLDAQRLADQNNMPFFEVNAKDNVGVQEMLLAIIQEMLKRAKEETSTGEKPARRNPLERKY